MTRLFVTGGAGFIGSNFIRYTLKKHPDHAIVNFDKLTYCGNPENLKDIKVRNYSFVKGDICDARAVERAMKGCGLVVNFAAQSHVDRSIRSSAEFVDTNVTGTRVLLDTARKLGVKRFLHISTDEVYGDIEKGFSREGDNLLPNSPYAATKAAADLLCRSYFRTYGFPVVITRSSNNFGPYQYPEKLIPLLMTNAFCDKQLPLYGDGRNVRDWIFVLDNCSAIDTVLHKGKPGEIYNIGGGNQIENIRIAREIIKLCNKDSRLIRFVADRPGHDRRYALCSSKVKRLGWKPAYSFSEALKLTIGWYRDNEWWWKPLKERADIIKW